MSPVIFMNFRQFHVSLTDSHHTPKRNVYKLDRRVQRRKRDFKSRAGHWHVSVTWLSRVSLIGRRRAPFTQTRCAHG